MRLHNWLMRFLPGDPVNKVCNTRNYNRIANILEDLEVIGSNGISAYIMKPIDAEGRGWIICVDGAQLRAMIGAAPEGVPKVLGGSSVTADEETWAIGAVDETTGKPTYPVFNPYRLLWSSPTLYQFRRTCTYDTAGNLVEVSAEVRSEVFTAVSEMP